MQCVEIMLCRNVVVSECYCVGILLCWNGDMSGYAMSGYALSGYVIYDDKQTDDPHNTHCSTQKV